MIRTSVTFSSDEETDKAIEFLSRRFKMSKDDAIRASVMTWAINAGIDDAPEEIETRLQMMSPKSRKKEVVR